MIGSKFSDHLAEDLKQDELAFHYLQECLEECRAEGELEKFFKLVEKVVQARRG